MLATFQRKPGPNVVNAADAIPDGTCRRCGFPGPHESRDECISGLRDRIAVLEFQYGAGRTSRDHGKVDPSRRKASIRAHDIPRFVAG